ncbi:MAG: zf-HC2 domain-containing protein [Candidatus Omnitrophica bacterium]|nr:zf-HC2 domain-containing protein [Candidatus Omnitrophota bacterium]
MNTCKNIKDLILTDYMDSEVDLSTREQISSHLLNCSHCRRFAAEAEKNLAVPFKGKIREDVPEHVWSSIRQSIENAAMANTQSKSFINNFIQIFSFPKLAPALGGFVVLLLMGTFILNSHQIKQVKEKEQGEYLASLWKTVDFENSDLRTPIEEYFL